MAPSFSSLQWRTAFLSLRDKTLTSPPTTTVLHNIIFSQSDTLIADALRLPPHEVLSDTMFLIELALTILDSEQGDSELVHTLTQLSHLIQHVSCHVSSEMSSSSWGLVLDYYGKLVEIVLGKDGSKRFILVNDLVIRTLVQCLETLRCFSTVYQRTSSLSENTLLLNFLLSIVSRFQPELINSSSSSGNWRRGSESGNNSLWEVQSTAFTMISEVYLRVGTYLPVDHWQSTVEVFRKVMDDLAAKGLLGEDIVLAKFYTSLLHCLHLILIDPKGSLSHHVAGFVAALRMFFNYGLSHKSQTVLMLASQKKEEDTARSLATNLTCSGPYRPPHLRKKDKKLIGPPRPMGFSDHEISSVDHMSSDSDCSDSDGSPKEAFNIRSSKARLAAIVCLQDLCRAEPKLITAQWTMLLPCSDVLQHRKFDATLMTCLLFDPYMKARIACASTIGTMLDGPAAVFLQIAEHKESTKCGSFMALSSSLGQILLQLHTGILYLIKHENHSGLVASLFKILMLLISSTPFLRMPAELLPTVISSLRERIEEGFLFRSDQNGLVTLAINCLTVALSVSPASPKVNDMFLAELSTGFAEHQSSSGVLSTLFRSSEPGTSPTISFEVLQALRAVAHNYPNIMVMCWDQVYSIVSRITTLTSPNPMWTWKSNAGNAVAAIEEKVITAAIKVLDECLRAITGFKGMEDLLNDDHLLESPFTYDCVKIKTISSAPSYGSESPAVVVINDDEHEPETQKRSGRRQWCTTIDSYMPLVLHHTSPMVRTATVTCFAGITSYVFFSLPKEKQDFIVTGSINAALNDEVPSVRSAACRAIGVIACFPLISRSAEIVDKFIYAAEINSRGAVVSVRITASWALANICGSLRHTSSTGCSVVSQGSSQLIPLLIDSAMRLTNDGDKIKANAVRALGNLSRIVHFTSQSGSCLSFPFMTNNYCEDLSPNSFQEPSLEDSYWLQRMVQAFLSSVTTGNVKVQWNVCHALRNLFLNETLKLRDMDWAPSVFSILLVLLRDSSNIKIKIHAAAALAVPASVLDYGRSFADVVQNVEQVLENLNSDQISTPSSFRYKVALEKQLTSTMLHLLGLTSNTDHQPIHDFLVKKSLFLEEWIKVLCSSLGEISLQEEHNSTRSQKRVVIYKAIQSLIEVYEGRNHHTIAQRFKAVLQCLKE